ncbi:MAG TPA: alpha/beta hydrolase [Polyangiaceae bacterium]
MHPNISTNVRFKLALRRASWTALHQLSPKAALRAATLSFLETPKRSPPAGPSALRNATRFGVRFGDQEIAAWSIGRGDETVLLVHGWGGRATQMRGFVEPLVEAGYRVVAFDAPGHGASTGSHLALPELAAAVRRVAVVIGPVHAVVAHSFGAAASTLAIAEGLMVERAVLLGPPADELPWFERFADQLGLNARERRELQHAVEGHVGAPFSTLAAESLGPALKLPLLVVHDRDDLEVPWADGARIARAAPEASLLTTQGLGHRRILRDARVIREAVRFIRGEPARESSSETIGTNACRQCGGATGDAWDGAGNWCASCGLQSRYWTEL